MLAMPLSSLAPYASDWDWGENPGIMVHSGRVFVQGTIGSWADDGLGGFKLGKSGTLILGGLPPTLRPTEDRHIAIYPSVEGDGWISKPFDTIVKTDGTWVFNESGEGAEQFVFFTPLSAVYICAIGDWATADAVTDTYPSDDLTPRLTVAFTTAGGGIAAHGNRTHLDGPVTAAEEGALHLLQTNGTIYAPLASPQLAPGSPRCNTLINKHGAQPLLLQYNVSGTNTDILPPPFSPYSAFAYNYPADQAFGFGGEGRYGGLDASKTGKRVNMAGVGSPIPPATAKGVEVHSQLRVIDPEDEIAVLIGVPGLEGIGSYYRVAIIPQGGATMRMVVMAVDAVSGSERLVGNVFPAFPVDEAEEEGRKIHHYSIFLTITILPEEEYGPGTIKKAQIEVSPQGMPGPKFGEEGLVMHDSAAEAEHIQIAGDVTIREGQAGHNIIAGAVEGEEGRAGLSVRETGVSGFEVSEGEELDLTDAGWPCEPVSKISAGAPTGGIVMRG